MTSKLLLIIFLFMSVLGSSQKIDTVLASPILNSYMCIKYKQPLFVSYLLYNGGGDESRSGLSFRSIRGITSNAGEYSHSGYDQGHMASAEDFANDSVNIRLTFYFYNCLPQTPSLNRGMWKNWETKVREESQNDSLLIICGGYDFRPVGKLFVPTKCFKVVKNLTTDVITHVLIFTNTASGNTWTESTLEVLVKQSKYVKLKELVK